MLQSQGRPVGALDAGAVVGDLDELCAVVLEADLGWCAGFRVFCVWGGVGWGCGVGGCGGGEGVSE